MTLGNEPDEYVIEKLLRAFASDPRTSELGVEVKLAGETVLLSGVVATAERRGVLGEIARELLPDHEVQNDVVVEELSRPGEAEEL